MLRKQFVWEATGIKFQEISMLSCLKELVYRAQVISGLIVQPPEEQEQLSQEQPEPLTLQQPKLPHLTRPEHTISSETLY